MELTQLKYFQLAAKYQNLTRAADELHVTQPTLSRSISLLEDELNVKFFDRQGKALVLNEYGHFFLGCVDRILLECQNAELGLLDLSAANLGPVRFALNFPDPKPSEFTYCMQSFMDAYPNTAVYKYQMKHSDILLSLQNGELDFGVTLNLVSESAYEITKLFTQRIGVIVASGHRLAQRRSVKVSELEFEKFVSYNINLGFEDMTSTLCAQAGFKPDIYCLSNESDLSSSLVSAGRAVSLTTERRRLWNMENAVNEYESQISFVPLVDSDGKPLLFTPYLIVPRSRYQKKMVRILIEMLIEQFKKSPKE